MPQVGSEAFLIFPDQQLIPLCLSVHDYPPGLACLTRSFDNSLLGKLYFDERARVAEILGVPGDGIAIQAGVSGILHQVLELFFAALFS
jgi:hypothetical protein